MLIFYILLSENASNVVNMHYILFLMFLKFFLWNCFWPPLEKFFFTAFSRIARRPTEVCVHLAKASLPRVLAVPMQQDGSGCRALLALSRSYSTHSLTFLMLGSRRLELELSFQPPFERYSESIIPCLSFHLTQAPPTPFHLRPSFSPELKPIWF